MRLGTSIEISTAHIEQITKHLDIMMPEVSQKSLETVEALHLAEHVELDELADESSRLDLGLDVDLVLLAHMVAEVIEEQLRQICGDFGHNGLESGDETRVESEQVESSALYLEERVYEPFSVRFCVQLHTELFGRFIDKLSVYAVRQLVDECVHQDLFLDKQKMRLIELANS